MRPIYVTETPKSFRIEFQYHPRLVEVIKRIPGKPRWDAADHCWIVPKSGDYPPERPANWYVNAFVQWSVGNHYCSNTVNKAQDEEITYDIPQLSPVDGEHYMLINPYEYQLEGVSYAVQHKRCIFGDQPGLGKTLQAICSVVKAHKEADKYGESFPALVICPASLKVNWQREFKKFSGLNAVILDDNNKGTWQQFYKMKKSDGESICNVFITNYESLGKFFVRKVQSKEQPIDEEMIALGIKPKKKHITMRDIIFDERIKIFKTIIIDESHKCKSTKTQQSKFVEGICKGKPFVFCLTGTPVVNNNTDLIQQLKILGRLEDFGGYRKFVDKFCNGPRQSSNLKELNWRLWSNCFFRREKSKVLSQLPDKTRQYMIVDITNRAEYDAAEADVVKYLRKYKNADDEKIQRTMRGIVMVKMGILKSCAAKGKVKAMTDFIHDVIDGGEKLIVFAFLKEVVEALKKNFPHAVTVTGSENMQQKQHAVDSFQNDDKCNLIILNYRSGGTGLTLTASSRVAFIEFPWTYADCEQAEDRAHRVGQKNNVNCYYFLGENTIDKYMYDIIQTKKDIANGVTGTETQIEEDMVNMTINMFKDKL